MALAISAVTKESMLSVTIRMVARAMSAMCTSLATGLPRMKIESSAISRAWSPIRSISVTIFWAAVMVRKSPATGCWCSSRRTQTCSTSRSSRLISCSSATVFSR